MNDPETRLLEYRQTQTGTGWHTAPDDGYLYDHLARYLKEAGQTDELLGLFADQNWMQARVIRDGYTYDGYIRDLNIAWDATASELRQQIDMGQRPTMLANCYRLSLIRTCINSLASDYQPEVIKKTVEFGIWSVERAWSIVKKAPRFELYAALLQTGQLSSSQSDELINDAYQHILHLRDHWHEQESPWWPPSPTVTWFLDPLLTMLPYFSEGQRRELLQFDLKWLLGYGWGKPMWSSRAVKGILPHLSQEEVLQLAHDSEEMFRKDSRPSVMALILPYLPTTQQRSWAEKVYQLALELPEPFYGGAKPIARILPTLESTLQEEALKKGIEIALKSHRDDARVSNLTLFIPLVPDSERETYIQQVFEKALAIEWSMGGGWVLTTLYPHLNETQKEQAFAFLMDIPERMGFGPFQAIVSVMPHLKTEQKRQTLQLCEQLSEQHNAPVAMAQLLPVLPDEMARGVLETILKHLQKLPDEEAYVESVAASIPHISLSERNEFVSWAFDRRHQSHVSSSPSFDTRLTQGLAPYLPPDLLDIAYQEAFDGSYSGFVRRYASLTPFLTETESCGALAKTLSHRHRYMSSSLHMDLSQLASSLVGRVQKYALRLALRELSNVQPPQPSDFRNGGYKENRALFDYGIARDLRQLAPYANTRQLDKIFTLLSDKIETGYCLAEGFIGLIPYLQGEQREHAVQHCFEIAKEERFHISREDLLNPIAPYLTPAMQQEVLQSAYQDRDITSAIGIVRRISPYLPGSVRQEALDWIFQQLPLVPTQNFQRAEVYGRLAPYFDLSRREESVQRGISDLMSPLLAQSDNQERRITILVQLIQLTENPTPLIKTLYQWLLAYMETHLDQHHAVMLHMNSTILSRLPLSILPSEMHAQIARHIMEICETWEWL